MFVSNAVRGGGAGNKEEAVLAAGGALRSEDVEELLASSPACIGQAAAPSGPVLVLSIWR